MLEVAEPQDADWRLQTGGWRRLRMAEGAPLAVEDFKLSAASAVSWRREGCFGSLPALAGPQAVRRVRASRNWQRARFATRGMPDDPVPE